MSPLGGQHRTTPSPILPPPPKKICNFGPKSPESPCKHKYANFYLKCSQSLEFPRHKRKLGSKNTIVTSYFRPEVERKQFRPFALKNMRHNPYLWPNRRNSRVLHEIGVKVNDGDIRFQTRSRNTPGRACALKNNAI